MPPMSAAVSPSKQRLGADRHELGRPSAASRRGSRDTAERKPAIVQIAVDIELGADAGEAREVGVGCRSRAPTSPNAVWPSSHHRPTVTIGTTMIASSCGAADRDVRDCMEVAECVDSSRSSIGAHRARERGLELAGAVVGERERTTACTSSATPIVATSTITRGALNSRRMTAISTTVPDSVPTSTANDERGPVRPVRLADHDREQRGRRHAEVADREVDDPARPVDEHDAHRDQRRRSGPVDEADEQQVGRPDVRLEAATPSISRPPSRRTRRGRGRRVRAARCAGPSNLTSPFSRKIARSEIASATFSDCSTMIIVWPRPCSWSTSSSMRCTTTGARPSDSSSISRISGSWISTRASASICCWPPDRLRGGCFGRSASSGKSSSTSSMRASTLAPCRRASRALTCQVLLHGQAREHALAAGQLHDADASRAARAPRR